jgi:hypothetical protein
MRRFSLFVFLVWVSFVVGAAPRSLKTLDEERDIGDGESALDPLVEQTTFFQAPSGNIKCKVVELISGDADATVTCAILKYSWKLPHSTCDAAVAVTVAMSESEPSTSCLSQLEFKNFGSEPADVLDYGASYQSAFVNCRSLKTGISCSLSGSVPSFGFSLARKSISCFQFEIDQGTSVSIACRSQ